VKDPTVPPAEDRKKIMFYDTPDRQARLRIRCQYDGMSQSQFFRIMVTGYIDGDKSIISYLDECKERYGVQGTAKRLVSKKFHEKSDEISKKFNLDSDEIESIFDVIETETEL